MKVRMVYPLVARMRCSFSCQGCRQLLGYLHILTHRTSSGRCQTSSRLCNGTANKKSWETLLLSEWFGLTFSSVFFWNEQDLLRSWKQQNSSGIFFKDHLFRFVREWHYLRDYQFNISNNPCLNNFSTSCQQTSIEWFCLCQTAIREK